MKRILIIRMGNIGDVLRVTPLIDLIRRRDPSAQIEVLVSDGCGFCYDRNPAVHAVIRHRKTRRLVRPVCEWLFRRKLAAKRYDEVILLEVGTQAVGFAVAASAGRSPVFAEDHANTRGHGFRLYRPAALASVAENFVRTYFGSCDLRRSDLELRLYPDADAVQKIKQMYGNVLDRAVVVHCTTTGTPPYRGFDVLSLLPALEAIAEKGLKIFFTAQAADPQWAQLSEKVKTQAVFFSGRTLPEVVALISCVSGVISPDTGVYHMAAALRKPVIGIWGPTSQVSAGVAGDSPSVIVRTGCLFNPCFDHDSSSLRAFPHCASGEVPQCLQRIDNDAVLKSFDMLFHAKS